MNSHLKYYEDRARRCDPKDYWGQVGRVLPGGAKVDDAQIQVILDSLMGGVELRSDDVLLDLCCGNGALTDRFFDRCQGGLGVDFSAPLIEVAKRDFERPGERDYVQMDAVSFAEQAENPERFTKAICNGAFQLIEPERAERLLMLLSRRFSGLQRLMMGNLPDKSVIREHMGDSYTPGIEDDYTRPVGMWRTAEEFEALAERTGWNCSISRRPLDWANYRYDAVLTRR